MALRRKPAVPESLEAVDAPDPAVFDPSFGEFVTIVAPGGDPIVLAAVTKLDPSTAAAAVALGTLRAETNPEAFDGMNTEVFVGGQAAFAADYVEITGRRSLIIFLLMLVFQHQKTDVIEASPAGTGAAATARSADQPGEAIEARCPLGPSPPVRGAVLYPGFPPPTQAR